MWGAFALVTFALLPAARRSVSIGMPAGGRGENVLAAKAGILRQQEFATTRITANDEGRCFASVAIAGTMNMGRQGAGKPSPMFEEA